MATRKPLVVVNGRLSELPAGDSVTGAVASGSTPVNETVAAGTTLSIPTGYQLAVHGAYFIDGTLSIDGKLVMP